MQVYILNMPCSSCACLYNTITLCAGNGGGYAVFGRVTGTGMSVVDAIQALQTYAFNSPYGQLPLTGYAGIPATVVVANLIVVNAAEAVPIFPSVAGQHSVVSFSVATTNPALVTPTVSGSALNLALVPGAFGVADLTVTATDSNGNAVQDSFRLNVTGGAPEISVEQPASADVADGGARAFPLTAVGSTADLTFTIRNPNSFALTLSGTPRVAVDGADASVFTVTAPPAAAVAAGGSTTFTVRFAPTGAGVKAAALHVASNVPGSKNPFDINLTGRALNPNGDDDGDGLSNQAELNLIAFGLDPLADNGALLTLLRDNGLYRASDMQTLALGSPLLVKDAATGHFHLSIGVLKSPNLMTWSALTGYSPTYIPATGIIDIDFTPDSPTTQFYRVLGAKP